jgi:Flp pilus assembly protein TadG
MTMAEKPELPLKNATAGAMSLEYGLVLPALLLFVVGTMEIGSLIWTYTTLSRAVEAAARCAAVTPATCETTAQIKARAVAEAWGLNVRTSDFAVAPPACGLRVTATYDYDLLIPWMGTEYDRPITLKVTACYPQ